MVRGIEPGVQEGDTTSNLSPDRKRRRRRRKSERGRREREGRADDNGRRKLSTWGAQKKREGGSQAEKTRILRTHYRCYCEK